MVELRGEITGDASGLLAAVRDSRRALNTLGRDGVKLSRGLTSAFTATTRAATSLAKSLGAVAAAATAVGVAAVSSFSKFTTAFAQVRTLVDESQTDVEALSDGVRDLARAFGVDAIEATRAAYQAISAGVEPARVVEFLGTAFEAAAAGASDVFQATDLLTTVMNAFGEEAGTADDVADVLFATVRAGKTTIDELAASLGAVAPIAAANSVAFEETAAALATLTKAGLSTAEASTALRALLVGIISPSEQASRALESIGVTAASIGAPGGLVDALGRVGEATASDNAELTDLFPNIRALTAAAILAGEGLDDLREITEQTANATGQAGEAFGKVADTIGFRFGQLRAELKDAFLELGELLTPLAEQLISTFSNFASNSRTEFDALARVIGDRSSEINAALESVGVKTEETGGIVTIALERSARAADALADALDAVAVPVAAIIAAFDLMVGVLTVGVLGALTGARAAVGGLIIAFETGAAKTLRVAALFAEFKGLTIVSDSFRQAADELEVDAGRIANEIDALVVLTQDAAVDLGSFEDTFTGVVGAIREARDATRGFAQENRDLVGAVREATQAEQELAASTAGAGGAASDTSQALGELAAAGDVASQSLDATRRSAEALEQSALRLVPAVQQASRVVGAAEFELRPGEAARISRTGQVEVFGATPLPSFDNGGSVGDSGPALLRRGEFVLTEPASQALGPAVLQALNALTPVDLGGVTINMEGRATGNLRDDARAIMPELQRAARRGVQEGSTS